MMPPTSQLLYIHLGMNADDDGYCEHFSIMRMTESKPDDLRVLASKGFVKVFDDKVLIITDWKENNYIQKDRYTPSKYLELYKEKECIQDVSKMDTQVRLGKGRLGKERIGKVSNNIASPTAPQDDEGTKKILAAFYEKVNPSLNFGNRTQREAAKFLASKFGIENVLTLIEALPETNRLPFAPRITTPYALREKMADLQVFIEQRNATSKPKIVKL